MGDTVGEWATVKAQIDARTTPRSQWNGTYKDGSVGLGALTTDVRNRLNRTGSGYSDINRLLARTEVAAASSGALALPAGVMSLADFDKLFVQIEVQIDGPPVQSALHVETIVLSGAAAARPLPVEFFVRSTSTEDGAATTANVNAAAIVDIDVMGAAWSTPVVTPGMADGVFVEIWGERHAGLQGRFEDLSDTPVALGDALSLLQVNQGRTALEFVRLMLDRTPVDGLRLALDRTTAGQITLRLESAQAHAGTRYAASSPDRAFSEAEWLAGNTATSQNINFPVTAALHYKGFAIPATEPSLTDIRVLGSPFNTRHSYLPEAGDADILQDINGVSHKTYIQKAPDYANDAEIPYTLR